MIEAFACVAGWQQLYQLWELIVMACKFLWDLLRLLGGGAGARGRAPEDGPMPFNPGPHQAVTVFLLTVSFARNARKSSSTRPGSSSIGMWTSPSYMTDCAPGIRCANCAACAGGIQRSFAPHSTSDGTSSDFSTSVSRSAKSEGGTIFPI